MKRILVGLLWATLSLPLAACGGADNSDVSAAIARVPEQDGRDLFVAIYSGLGDEDLNVPAQIPRESRQKVDLDQAMRAWNSIADVVDALDPSFFAKFSSDLRSGEPYLVEAAFNSGSELAGEAVPLALSGAVVAEPEVVEKCTVGVWACVTLAVAFHTAAGAINYIGGINIALAVNIWVWKFTQFWEGSSLLQTQRQTEAFVKDMTERLEED